MIVDFAPLGYILLGVLIGAAGASVILVGLLLLMSEIPLARLQDETPPKSEALPAFVPIKGRGKE